MKQRVRLPIEIKRPQFPTERNVFRLANGVSHTIQATVRKTYLGETDYMPEKWHERLVIAFNHDDVTIEGDKYLGGITLDSDYQIEWPEFFDYPTSKANFTVQVTPFDATNANCQSCEEANQLDVEDDEFPDTLEEGEEYTINVTTNDNICCYPAVFSVITYDGTYIQSATIASNGELTVVVKNSIPTSSLREVVSYRVECPNGSYDDGIVSASFSGTLPEVCGPVSNVVAEVVDGEVTVTFDEPSPGANTYSWEVEKTSNAGVVIDSGSVASSPITISGLDLGFEYQITIISNCDDNDSVPVTLNFIIPASVSTCGRYSVTWISPDGFPSDISTIDFVNCAGESEMQFIYHAAPKLICALQTSPGAIVSLVGATYYAYVEPC